MHNLTTVATQVGVLFALMGVGAACRWFRLVDDGAMKGMVRSEEHTSELQSRI